MQGDEAHLWNSNTTQEGTPMQPSTTKGAAVGSGAQDSSAQMLISQLCSLRKTKPVQIGHGGTL